MELYSKFLKSQLYTRKSPNLIKLGFDFSAKDIENEFLKIQSLLYTEYHIKCESMLTIMKKFDIPSSKTMDILFKVFDIEPRSLSEANLVSIQENRCYPFEKLNLFVNIKHTSWCGINCHLRSSYELEYAKQLDDQKIKYFVEHMRIKYLSQNENRYRIAIPDFYLPETNTITEVKSTYWLNVNEMVEKSKAYRSMGYNFNLYLDHVLYENWCNGWDSNPHGDKLA